MEWNKLDVTIRNSETLTYFRNALLEVGQPKDKPIYNINNRIGLKLLTINLVSATLMNISLNIISKIA